MAHQYQQKLQSFLAEKWQDQTLQIDEMKELSSGWSRTTYLLTVFLQDGKKDLIVQVEKPKSVVLSSSVEHDYAVLKAVEATNIPAPKPYILGLDPTLLGGPFIVLSKDSGRTFDLFKPKHQLQLMEYWENNTPLPEDVLDNLIKIHNAPVENFSFLPKAPSAEETGAYEIERCRQIAEEIGMARDPFIYFIFQWLNEFKPETGYLTMVHGDFHIRNVLIDHHRVSSVLDWELTRISNPLFDLAYMCIPYLAGKVFTKGSPYACGLLPKDVLIREYERKTNRKVKPQEFQFWRVLSTLSLLLIIETGVSTYERKQTDEIRSAWLRLLIPVLQEDILQCLTEKVPDYSKG